jgi:excisionase family DNA binding protein
MEKKTHTVEVREVAEALGIGLGTTYAAARKGTLPFPCIKVGARFVIPEAPFRRFLETGKAA